MTDSAAAIAFFSLISLVPLLLLGVAVAGLVLGEQAAQGEMEKQVSGVMGSAAAGFLEGMLGGAHLVSHGGPVSTGIVFVVLVFSGSHALAKLRSTLNTINGVAATDPARPVLGRLFARGVSSLLILLFGALLILGTIVEGLVAHFADEISSPVLAGWQVVRGYEQVSSYLILAVAFLVILKVLPRRRPLWRHALVGALVAALAVGSLKFGFDIYLRRSTIASVYGTGLTTLVFFIWMLASVQAFLAGALVTALLGKMDKGGKRP